MTDDENFRKLPLAFRFKAGATVYPFEPEVAWKDLKPLTRPLVLGEKVATTGLFGEIRIGEIVQISEDGKTAQADDGACILFLQFDKDEDHEWTMGTMAEKSVLEENDWSKP